MVPDLARHRRHHADGRADVDLLRAGRGASLHRPPGHLLHRRRRRCSCGSCRAAWWRSRRSWSCNKIRGGGVYSFSYLVLGPVASFVAVASIMVDYILTACISTVSAVINGTVLLRDRRPRPRSRSMLGIIWARRRPEHPRHPRERPRHVLHLRRRGVRLREPDRARRPQHGAEQPGASCSAAPATPSADLTQRRARARDLGDHHRRRELRAGLLRHRVGDPDRRPGARAGATSRRPTGSSR